jgi:hypothetical protein
MSEESKAQEKSKAQKPGLAGALMAKWSPLVDPAKFPDWPGARAMQQLEELQRASQSWQNLMSPALAAFNEINQRAAEAVGEMNRVVEHQARLFQHGVNFAIFEQTRPINEKTHDLLSIDWEAIAREHAQGAKQLADRGWFLSMDSPFYFHRHFSVMIRAGRWEECERELQDHFEELLPTIRDNLAARFAERKAILEEAFGHHSEGKYFGAISLFLSQSEGVGRDIFGASPLSRKPENVQILKDWLDQRVAANSWFDEFWRSILRVLPITARTDRLAAYKDPLNRHRILHGEDLTYGTKRNSLKAIAWIQYVASFATLDELHGPLGKSASSS